MRQVCYAGRKFQFDTRRDHIDRMMRKGHFYEEAMLSYIRGLAIPGWYMDVGAFIGTHTVFFSELCSSIGVYAFEPCPDSFECLKLNVASLVGERRPVSLWPYAVGAEPGYCTVHEGPPENRGHTTVRMGEGRTPVVRLDDFGIRPLGLIKIDVEGGELAVLRGAKEHLQRDRPHLFVEAVDSDYRKTMESMLAKFGYRHIRQFNASPTHHFAP